MQDKTVYTVRHVATKGNLTIYEVIERSDYDDTSTVKRGKAKRTANQVGPVRPGSNEGSGKGGG